ncbi:hypothetical protein SCHPADRAFT_946286 [Schizopora paradoxa]|uniref:Uncharacterized protein n=1 Tax=Schizopora paradoxa TaxID=27342 RepID=A0A0H2R9M6_9AGAM|nr:hypothetical protein SCHPADRAFT_946286 [Schizopora paradoxa]
MKIFFTVLALAACAFAQNIEIAFPTEGMDIEAGSTINVQVVEHSGSSSLANMGFAVTFQHCEEDPCENFEVAGLGGIFFVGPFNPQDSSPPQIGGVFQNVSVTIDSETEKGLAIFNVPRAALIGANAEFFTEVANVTVNIV